MPAPTIQQIKANITEQLLSRGFYSQVYNPETNEIDVDENVLMPQLEPLIEGISQGIADTWTQWQATQTVAVVGVQTGTGAATGTLP